MCVCLHVCTLHGMYVDNLWELVFSLLHVGSGDQSQVMRLDCKHLYPLYHLPGHLTGCIEDQVAEFSAGKPGNFTTLLLKMALLSLPLTGHRLCPCVLQSSLRLAISLRRKVCVCTSSKIFLNPKVQAPRK